MNLPNSILELIFIYLNWQDRSRAARVCRKWLRAFQSSFLWRSVVFKPPIYKLNKLQYDIKCYRISCCLRAIGYYIRSYSFLKNEDIFLLHRTLCLVASFLEYTSLKKHKAKYSRLEFGLNEFDDNSIGQFGNGDNNDDFKHKIDDFESSRHKYFTEVEGDPYGEADLRFILNSERLNVDQSDLESLSEEDVGINVPQFRSFSLVSPLSPVSTNSSIPSECYVRSDSLQTPSVVKKSTIYRHCPIVLHFELEFYCEVDEFRGFVYGTGGALLSSIRRVVSQLFRLQRLKLMDLFLDLSDARKLVLDLSQTTSQNLLDLNLVHLHKLRMDVTETVLDEHASVVRMVMIDSRYSRRSVSGLGDRSSLFHQRAYRDLHDDEWYLLDRRWLEVRPNNCEVNPLADLAHLFPNLKRLTLAPIQLTGPMLLRLLFRSKLEELCLVQTNLTFYTLPSVSDEESQNVTSLYNGDFYPDFSEINSQFIWDDLNDPNLIDWTDDVPQLLHRSHVRNSHFYWKPISSNMWKAALILNPNLYVRLKLKIVERSTFGPEYMMINRRMAFDQLLSYFPVKPAPVYSISLIVTGEINFLGNLLCSNNKIIENMYSMALTSIIIYFEFVEINLSSSDQELNDVNNSHNNSFIDQHLIDLFAFCPNMQFLALGGGQTPYVHILTILTICRQKALFVDSQKRLFQLVLQNDSCMFNGNCPSNVIPDSISSWYSTMVLESALNQRSISQVAECCISVALNQKRWHFVNNSQFCSQMNAFM